jgi:hypothetical protein
MTEAEAAWVRENVWTQPMRKTHREVPAFYVTCACQRSLTSWCGIGRCELCHRATPQRSYETVICGQSGNDPRYFPEPYAHDTDVSAIGPRRERLAMVWLADRACRWVCPHTCHAAPAKPVAVQLDLFAAA